MFLTHSSLTTLDHQRQVRNHWYKGSEQNPSWRAERFSSLQPVPSLHCCPVLPCCLPAPLHLQVPPRRCLPNPATCLLRRGSLLTSATQLGEKLRAPGRPQGKYLWVPDRGWKQPDLKEGHKESFQITCPGFAQLINLPPALSQDLT